MDINDNLDIFITIYISRNILKIYFTQFIKLLLRLFIKIKQN